MPAWYLTFDREIAEIDPTSIDWRALSKSNGELEKVARSLGLKSVLSFFSVSRDEARGVLGTLRRIVIREHWFEPAEALKTTAGLLAHFRSHPDAVPRQEKVVQELEDFDRILRVLEQNGVRFHVSIDI